MGTKIPAKQSTSLTLRVAVADLVQQTAMAKSFEVST